MRQIHRVRYGLVDTPEHLREYQIDGKGPVGCLKEFKETFPGEDFIIIDTISKVK